ncbi:MAG TPA: PLP-dependent aminotransferase family protein [Clostridiales bacterium]|nr:PLP-dependent aminotransferase family protein [Clostridiales bacterium]
MNIITIMLDKKSSTPLFEQIYSHIKFEILNGNYIFNTKLPSKRKLADHLKCSQNTVQAAYNQLVSEGYLVSKQRSGYYVCKLDGILNISNKKNTKINSNSDKSKYKYHFSYHGVDLENFPFITWRRINRDSINEFDQDFFKAGHPQGLYELRESICHYLRSSRSVKCIPEQIIISSGTELILQLLIQAFNESSVFGLENPGYERLSLLFKSNNRQYKAIPLDKDGMILSSLERSAADIISITPSHQFPTGNIMPINRRIQLLNWANQSPNRYIIEDDYDSEFKYSGKPIPSLQGLDNYGKVIYIGSFSKSLSPSMRISYAVLPQELLNEYKENLNFYICPVPYLEQKILHTFISEGYFERHLNKMRNIYKKKREALVLAIKELLPNADISGENAGLHIILNPNNGLTETELVLRAKLKGVKVNALSQYYINKDTRPSETQLLLGFASLSEKEIYKAVNLLYDAWL